MPRLTAVLGIVALVVISLSVVALVALSVKDQIHSIKSSRHSRQQREGFPGGDGDGTLTASGLAVVDDACRLGGYRFRTTALNKNVEDGSGTSCVVVDRDGTMLTADPSYASTANPCVARPITNASIDEVRGTRWSSPLDPSSGSPLQLQPTSELIAGMQRCVVKVRNGASVAQLRAADADMDVARALSSPLVTSALETQRRKIASLEERVAVLQRDLAAAQRTIAEKTAQIQTLTSQLQDANQRLALSQAEVAAKRAEINRLTQDLANARSEQATIRQRLEAAMNDANAARQQLDRQRQEREQQQREQQQREQQQREQQQREQQQREQQQREQQQREQQQREQQQREQQQREQRQREQQQREQQQREQQQREQQPQYSSLRSARRNNYCVDVLGFNRNDGATVGMWTCNGAENQAWMYDSRSRRIQSRFSGKCLDVSGGQNADGAPVIQHTCHDGANQKWTRTADYKLKPDTSAQSDMCLTVPNSRTDDGAPLQLTHCGFAAQFVFDGPAGQQAPQQQAGPPAPKGTYLETCQGCMLARDGNPSVLTCSKCRRANGSWTGGAVTNALFVPYCNNRDISNRDGSLAC